MVTASASSNASLICLVEIDPDGCADSLELQWRHFRFNSSVLIKGDEKYEIQEKKTDTKCKIEFILTINNVTKDDEAKYSCNSDCRVGSGYVNVRRLIRRVTLHPVKKNYLLVPNLSR